MIIVSNMGYVVSVYLIKGAGTVGPINADGPLNYTFCIIFTATHGSLVPRVIWYTQYIFHYIDTSEARIRVDWVYYQSCKLLCQ